MADAQDFDGELYLDPDSELRCEIASSMPPGSSKQKQTESQQQGSTTIGLELKLLGGNAELFGTELAKNIPYTFPPESKIAIYTWHGCTLHVKGRCEVRYISRETPMNVYLNTHAALNQLRQRAAEDWALSEKLSSEKKLNPGEEEMKPNTRGPRVFVTGFVYFAIIYFI